MGKMKAKRKEKQEEEEGGICGMQTERSLCSAYSV